MLPDENPSAEWSQGPFTGRAGRRPGLRGNLRILCLYPEDAGLDDHYTLSVRCHMSEIFWISVAGNELMIPSALAQDLSGFVLSAGTRALLATCCPY
jgi:hypothetical protein